MCQLFGIPLQDGLKTPTKGHLISGKSPRQIFSTATCLPAQGVVSLLSPLKPSQSVCILREIQDPRKMYGFLLVSFLKPSEQGDMSHQEKHPKMAGFRYWFPFLTHEQGEKPMHTRTQKPFSLKPFRTEGYMNHQDHADHTATRDSVTRPPSARWTSMPWARTWTWAAHPRTSLWTLRPGGCAGAVLGGYSPPLKRAPRF